MSWTVVNLDKPIVFTLPLTEAAERNVLASLHTTVFSLYEIDYIPFGFLMNISHCQMFYIMLA